MLMTTAIYPATFDPITLGHVDIATRAAMLFDVLYVGVYDRSLKNLLFSAEERWNMTVEALSHLDNVQVLRYRGMTVDFARERNSSVIVRGLRAISDFEWEFQLAHTNHSLVPNIDTVCLMASQKYSFLSSSIVKDVAFAGGDISEMVPSNVVEPLLRRICELNEECSDHIKLVTLRD
jgi:pantetheine-phosphate adenylyltransferase